MKETSALVPLPYKTEDPNEKDSLLKKFEKEIEDEYNLGINPATKIKK